MARYDLTTPAKNDLREILRYTKETWGAEQAVKYSQQLRKALGTLAQTPGIGRLREKLAIGLRSLQAGSYTVFYKQSAAGIIVVRILHSKRDIEHQLEKENDKTD